MCDKVSNDVNTVYEMEGGCRNFKTIDNHGNLGCRGHFPTITWVTRGQAISNLAQLYQCTTDRKLRANYFLITVDCNEVQPTTWQSFLVMSQFTMLEWFPIKPTNRNWLKVMLLESHVENMASTKFPELMPLHSCIWQQISTTSILSSHLY